MNLLELFKQKQYTIVLDILEVEYVISYNYIIIINNNKSFVDFIISNNIPYAKSSIDTFINTYEYSSTIWINPIDLELYNNHINEIRKKND